MVDIDDGKLITLLDDTAQQRAPLLDIALGPALLSAVAAGGGSEQQLRLYRPGPTLAFSGRDCATEGIAAAAAAARAAGFEPVRRGPGGRAAGYHRASLCLDHVAADPHGRTEIRARFTGFGELLVEALRAVGADARLGPVPGEYCPGEFSINDGHGHKLVGTAQRLVRGGWLFGTVILVTDPEPVRSGVYLDGFTTDDHPIIDHHPESERIALALGFSGHGYKMAPAIGVALADLIDTGGDNYIRGHFSATRAAIQPS